MKIVRRAILSAAQPGTEREVATSPAFTAIGDGTLIASYSIGTGKDSDDLTIELRRSKDGGETWSTAVTPFATTLEGRRGSLKAGPVTRVDGDHLIVAALWIDREAFPGRPLFNPDTEGCLPMAILVADSEDSGQTWSAWRKVDVPDDLGPPSLTNPILVLADRRLVLSVESNKPYLDQSRWLQRVAHLRSRDHGLTWSQAETVCADVTGRIANWDQRGAIAPDGRFVTFTWTYDFEAVAYRNIQRRISTDGGSTFGPAEDMGVADQPGHPAILGDGRMVLAWVDRFGSEAIRARVAEAIDAPLDPRTELIIHHAGIDDGARTPEVGATTGDALVEMGTWRYGLPYAESLPDGDVGVVYYAAGARGGTDIRWARVGLDG